MTRGRERERMDQQGRAERARSTGAGAPATPTGAAFDRVLAVTTRLGDPTTPGPRRGVERPAARAGTVATAGEQDGAEVALDQVLTALVLLRQLRADLESWEPRLIAAARQRGASWAELAPALGVASRQAAERRYLRLRPAEDDAAPQTRDDRVRAERDRRAGDRAAARWARDNGADLRQLAGQITALTDLGSAARPSLDRLHDALGGTDPNALVRPLADTRRHLRSDHPALAAQVDAMNEHLDEVRQRTARRRGQPRG
ncbi:HSP18 transcriptional regulator [Plantactinospora sp. BC1]|uniref:HSP18 transcriptional regulator n=1 Tax=Plantactinospora sp. BC1 TaxID=2108470 RepID=UPI00131EFC14|nr:HSP18 transcriptional regulator [Plantactinospora sp. BC1]